MIMDRPDLLIQITKQICETCSTHEDMFSKISDYTMTEYYGKDKDGNEVSYNFNIEAQNRKLERKWLKLSAESAKKKLEEKNNKK